MIIKNWKCGTFERTFERPMGKARKGLEVYVNPC